jgi:hypothetical protein
VVEKLALLLLIWEVPDSKGGYRQDVKMLWILLVA